MNGLQIFKNKLFEVGAKVEGDEILFDVEQVAKCLGITSRTVKNGVTYENVRWTRVNEYIGHLLPLVAEIQKGDLIPEPLVYKLAFKASNEVAEQFQDWLAIEVIPQIRKTGSFALQTAQLSPELQMFNQLFKAIANTELKQQEQDARIEKVEKEQENITEVVSLNIDGWKNKVSAILNRIAIARGGGDQFRKVRSESYEMLEKRGKCRLNIRLENLKKEAQARGICSPSKIRNFNKIDVIEADTRLTEIYLAIVKEMAIRHSVNAEGLGA